MLCFSLQNLHPSHTDVILKQTMLGSAMDFPLNLLSLPHERADLGSVLLFWIPVTAACMCTHLRFPQHLASFPVPYHHSIHLQTGFSQLFIHSFTNSETLCEVSAWSVAFKLVTLGQMLCGYCLEAPGAVVQPFRKNRRSHPLFKKKSSYISG